MNEHELKEMISFDGDFIIVSINVFDRGNGFDIINEDFNVRPRYLGQG